MYIGDIGVDIRSVVFLGDFFFCDGKIVNRKVKKESYLREVIVVFT